MHQKRRDYKKCGVLEYMVACLQERKLHWFHFPSGAEIVARRGVYRSRVFPGLWIDGAALFARDLARLLQVAHQGLALADHAAFVHKLAAAKRRSRRPTK